MGAIGAVTSVRMPPVQPAAATLPVQGTTTLRAPGEPSGVHGIAYTGDVLADRVIGTFAVDPFRYGSLDGAIGVVSGSFNFNPAPSAVQPSVAGTAVAIDPGNALLNLPPSAAAALSPAEFIARSQSSIAKVYRGFVTSQGAGQSVQRGVAGMVVELDHALRRDEQGLTSFDHQVMAIEQQRAEQVRKLKERLGDPKDVVAKLMSLTIAQGMVQREREKLEELRNLLISLLIGVQVPKGTVERLGALGMGPLVEQLVQMMVGGGRGLSKGMQESLRSLIGELGLNISILQEADTEVGMREAQRVRELQATVATDGRLVDSRGRTVDPHAVRGDLAELLRRRAAGIDAGELDGAVLATAGASGVVSGTGTDGATGIAT